MSDISLSSSSSSTSSLPPSSTPSSTSLPTSALLSPPASTSAPPPSSNVEHEPNQDQNQDQDQNKDKDEQTHEDVCPICQETINESSNVRTLQCDHQFHNECISKWIEIRNLCPLCNAVADTKRQVQELKVDNEDLSQQLIQQLLSNRRRPNSLSFWSRHFAHAPSAMSLFSPLLQQADRMFMNVVLHPNPEHEEQPHPQNNHDQYELHPQPHPQPHRQPQPNPRHHRQNDPNSLQTRVQYLIERNHRPDICEDQAQCAQCGIISCVHAVRRCSQCLQVRYCSRRCQEIDWNHHREWCLSHVLHGN